MVSPNETGSGRRDEIRRDYASLARDYETRWRAFNTPARDWILAQCPDDLAPDGRVLDLACGTGGLLAALGARHPGLGLFGLDLSPDMLARARAAVPGAALVEGDATAPPFRDGAFDVVCALNLLHHLDSVSDHLDILAALCRPGGTVFLCTFRPEGSPLTRLADWWLRRTHPAWRGIVSGADLERAVASNPALSILRSDVLSAGRFWRLRILQLARAQTPPADV